MTTSPFNAISLTIKSVNIYLVTAGMGYPLLMQQVMPTSSSYRDQESCFSWASAQDCIVVLQQFDQLHNKYCINKQYIGAGMSKMKLDKTRKQKLTIQIKQPELNNKGNKNKPKYSKQIMMREKHQIQQMENQIKKLTNNIESEKKILKNRILIQELQQEIKRNQIASKMSKKEIIMKRLEIIKGGKDIVELSGPKKKLNIVPINILKQTETLITQTNPESKSSLPKIRCRSNQSNIKFPSQLPTRMQNLRSRTQKQKQYGDRVQREYHSNRAKSAFSYLQLQKQASRRKSRLEEERNKILEQLKKPSIPIQISQVDRKKQIDRIRHSQNSPDTKLQLLNYLTQVEVNRVKLKQIKGFKEGDLDLLGYINKARTQIMLKHY